MRLDNKRSIALASILLIFVLGVFPSAFAQLDVPIFVTIDKESYAEDETIVISGEVREVLSGFPVTLSVIAADGDNIVLAQLEVDSYKKFSTELKSGGPLWDSTGVYTLKVLYGTEARTAETTFYFFGTEPEFVPPLSVETDQELYAQGNTVTISGFIKTLHRGYSVDVTVIVVAPTGDIVTIVQVSPNAGGSYSTELSASLFQIAGEYTVKAQYGAQQAESTFEFTGGDGTAPEPEPKTEDDLRKQIADLKKQKGDLMQKNVKLQMEIGKLKYTIDKLNELVREQLKVIYDWVISR